MRVFTVLGLVFLVAGVGLVLVAVLPHGGGITGDMTGMAAAITAVTLLPLGIVFTLIGLWWSRLTGARRRLLESGVPGQATILSVGGGNVVVNNVNALLTFQLRVMLPGRAPYEVEHKQFTSMFHMASFQVGATVPVMVDPEDPRRLTLDLTGEGAAARTTRVVTDPADMDPPLGVVMPNTLSSMGGVAPNTISSTIDSGLREGSTAPWPSAFGSALPDAAAAATMAAVQDQLARLGISIDPVQLAGGQLTMEAATLDLRPGVQESVLATGRPGTAIIRSITDTGVNVRGDSLVRLTLDVTPEGGQTYEVASGGLVPELARARAYPGATVHVRIDPAQPTSVAIDWMAAV